MVDALEKARIPYYETPSANWGPGQPAIWVKNEHHAQEAFGVISAAQKLWRKNAEKRKSAESPLVRKTSWLWVFVIFVAIVLFVQLFYSGSRL